MTDSSLSYTSNASLEQLTIIASGTSVTIYVAPSGSDINTGLSSSSPVFSLKKAWSIAQQYNIVGNGQLYITFAGGTYGYSDAEVPDNMYHPQGGNIIIQGDPAAVKQRYLYRVQNYSWDISRISYHGHTGTVNLTNLQAGHTHGYTAADNNMWVAISNPCLSSAGNTDWTYYDPTAGVNYTGLDTATLRTGIYGDMFFNHGYSYEHANGIYGLAQIADASTSTTDLQLIFKNTNTDPRIPAFSPYTKGAVSNGIGNTIPWYGVANNYPENQYSKPNGFYGKDSWSGTIAYPQKSSFASDSHITDQPQLVTSFPVVIQKTGSKPLFTVAGGSVKAIRNFMLVANDFAVPNASANKTKALNALYPTEEHSPQVTASAWQTALLRAENATVGIRHLGVYHAEFGICATNSKITTYTESSAETAFTTITGVHDSGAYATSANLGHPDNTPVLTAVNVSYGIYAHSSTVQIGYESDRLNPAASFYTTEQGCFIQSSRTAIVATDSSDVAVRSAVINSTRVLPRFQFVLRIPVFAGASATTGSTYSFMYPTSWGGTETTSNSNQAFQNGYTAAAVFMRTGAATGYTLGYITNIAGGGTAAYSSGQYTSTHSVAGTPVPAYYQTLNVYGYRVGDINGLSFALQDDFNSISSATGYTLEFVAFSDNETTTAGGKFEIGKNAFKTTAAGGQSIIGLAANATTQTSTGLPYSIVGYRSYRWFSGTDSYDTSVGVYRNSTLRVRKNLLFAAADNRAVYVADGSKLLADFGHNAAVTRGGSTTYQNDEMGALLVNGAGNYAVTVRSGSYAGLGSVFAKCFKSVIDATYALNTTIGCIAAENNSVIDLPNISPADNMASVVCVLPPYGTPAWSSIQGALAVVDPAIVVLSAYGSAVNWGIGCVNLTSAFDGFGAPEQSRPTGTSVVGGVSPTLAFYYLVSGSRLGRIPAGTTSDNSIASTQLSHVFSVGGTPTANIMSRASGFKYNLPTTSQYYRWWQITGSKPTVGGGRTAGIWSTTGEAVRRVGWIAPAAFDFKNGADNPISSCGPLGLTYAGAGINSTAVPSANGGSDPNASPSSNPQKKNSVFYT